MKISIPIFKETIKSSKCLTRVLKNVLTMTIWGIIIQVFGHPHLLPDGGILVHLSISFIGKCASVGHAVAVSTLFRTDFCSIPTIVIIRFSCT